MDEGGKPGVATPTIVEDGRASNLRAMARVRISTHVKAAKTPTDSHTRASSYGLGHPDFGLEDPVASKYCSYRGSHVSSIARAYLAHDGSAR